MTDDEWKILAAAGSPAWRAAREPVAAQELATAFGRLEDWGACGEALAFVANAPSAVHAYAACDRPTWLEWLYEGLEERLRVFLRDGQPCSVAAAWRVAQQGLARDPQTFAVKLAYAREAYLKANEPFKDLQVTTTQTLCDAYRRHYPFELVRRAFQVAAAREVRDA